MRYAIVSDIHANLSAWNAVLADIRSQNVDVIVCLGDVVGYGPKAAEVLEAVRAETDHFVMGNHDAAAVGMMDYSIFNDHARQAIEWTMTELSAEQKQFLSSVPLAIEAGDILFVHAEIAEPGRFDYIDGVEIAQENFNANEHFVTFVGHTHLPKMFEQSSDKTVLELADEFSALDAEKRYIINVGSVGEPRNPDDLRARYVIYNIETREVDFRRVEFDIVAYRHDLESTTLALRPYFLRVYEQVVEGREVVTSSGGSLVDMQVAHDSAALVDLGQVSSIVQLGNPAAMLASAQPSRKPLFIGAAAAALIIGSLIFWLTRDKYPSSKENEIVIVRANDHKPPEDRETSTSKKVPQKEVPNMNSRVASNSNKNDLPEKRKPPKPAPLPQKPKPKPKPNKPKPKPVAIVKTPEKVQEGSWWRMDKEDAEKALVDESGQITLVPIKPGQGTRPIAPNPVPLPQVDNTSALLLGIWQEEKPSGKFALNSNHSFTFEGWFIADKIKRPLFLLGTRTGNGPDNQGWHIDLRPRPRGAKADQMAFFYDSGKKRAQALAEDLNVADKKPHHFAVTWDHKAKPGEGQMTLFLDGVQVASASVTHSDISGKQAHPFRVGGPGNRTPLALDEIRFTPRVLPSHEFLLKTPILGAKMIQSNPANRDSWSIAKNWEGGKLPNSTDNVIIGEGVTAQVQKSPPTPYSGLLVLQKKSKLELWLEEGAGALPKSPSRIVMHAGSHLILRIKDATLGPIELIGDAKISGGKSTSGHNSTRYFKGEIKGDAKLEINGVNGNQFRFETANSFTGGLEAHSTQDQPFYLSATSDSAFGTGDLEIKDKGALVIGPQTQDTIADTAVLRLEGPANLRVNGQNGLFKLIMNADETVGGFFIDGKDQGEGVFSNETHPIMFGPGKLIVKKPR